MTDLFYHFRSRHINKGFLEHFMAKINGKKRRFDRTSVIINFRIITIED